MVSRFFRVRYAPIPIMDTKKDAGGDNKTEKDATSQLNEISVRLVTTPLTSNLMGTHDAT
jgi:hypothetical protein